MSTGSKNLSATGAFSLFLLFIFTTATYVVETELTFHSALLLVSDWCTAALRNSTSTPCSLVDHACDELLDLYTFVCAPSRTSITSIQNGVDFGVEFIILRLCSTYPVKSGQEVLEQGLFTPKGSVSISPFDLFNRSLSPSTSNGTISEVALVSADVDRTTITIDSTCVPKSSRAGQGDVLPSSSTDSAALPNASLPAKSSVAFPRIHNTSAGGDSTGRFGPDIFADTTVLPKRTRKIAIKHSDFVNVAKVWESFAVASPPGLVRSPLPRTILREDPSDSSFASSDSPSLVATATSCPPSSTCKTASTTPWLSQSNLQSDFEPENAGDHEEFTNVTGTVPNIVISEHHQDRGLSAAPSLSSSIIAALAVRSTPTSQITPLTLRLKSTLGTSPVVAFRATDDPARSTSLLLTPPQAAIIHGRLSDLAYNSSSSNASST
ncbi:hypothetical protein FS837_011085, partial [Tulasnella sp. UAMH 9824]